MSVRQRNTGLSLKRVMIQPDNDKPDAWPPVLADVQSGKVRPLSEANQAKGRGNHILPDHTYGPRGVAAFTRGHNETKKRRADNGRAQINS